MLRRYLLLVLLSAPAAAAPPMRLPLPAKPDEARCAKHREKRDAALMRLITARWKGAKGSGAAKAAADQEGKDYYAKVSLEWCRLDAKSSAYEAWTQEMLGLDAVDPSEAARWVCEWPESDYARVKTAWRVAEGLKELMSREAPLGLELLKERETPPERADGTVDLSLEGLAAKEAAASDGRLSRLGARALAQRGRWERLREACTANTRKLTLARAEGAVAKGLLADRGTAGGGGGVLARPSRAGAGA